MQTIANNKLVCENMKTGDIVLQKLSCEAILVTADKSEELVKDDRLVKDKGSAQPI